VIDQESDSEQDPYMAYGQPAQSWTSGDLFATVAATLYSFSSIDSISAITNSPGTNADSSLSSSNLATQFGTNMRGGKVGLIGEYINNYETSSSEDTAWTSGAKYGFDKWGFKYVYADVEANSVPDILPDSDRFGGLTGIRGHEVELTYKIMKNVKLGLDFYSTERTITNEDEELLQADINVKS
jgi:hypothetical protein